MTSEIESPFAPGDCRKRIPPPELSDRQREVLKFAERGLTNQEIADKLGIRKTTVKGHFRAAFDKLEVRNRVDAATAARKRGSI